jgi:hypothetical protein
VIGKFALASHDELIQVLREPAGIHELLHPIDDGESFGESPQLSVEKDWHGIHFLLNQGAWDGEPPLDFIVAGGTEVGEVDVGHGPARAFLPAELRAIVEALAPITEEHCRLRFDAEAMNTAQIYPSIWKDTDARWLAQSCMRLRDFLRDGAEHGQGLLVWCE